MENTDLAEIDSFNEFMENTEFQQADHERLERVLVTEEQGYEQEQAEQEFLNERWHEYE